MTNYEKLIGLLERNGADVSLLIALKKNELITKGSHPIDEVLTFDQLLEMEDELIFPEVEDPNPFFMELSHKEQASQLSMIEIINYKTQDISTINEILGNDDLIDTEKKDIIYRGFQALSNDYKLVLDTVMQSDLEIITAHKQLVAALPVVFKSKWLLKNIVPFWLCAAWIISINHFFLQASTLRSHTVLTFSLNVIFNVFVFFPFFKIVFYHYLEKVATKEKKSVQYITKRYEQLVGFNDSQIERVEIDLFNYMNRPINDKSIDYLKKTNKQLKKTHLETIKCLVTNTRRMMVITEKSIKTIHWVAPVSLIIWLLYFVLM